MEGYIMLQGGAEFGGEMKKPDLRALELAGGADATVCILPTAAAPDNNHRRAGGNGRDWFAALGAANVSVIGVVDRSSANDTALAAQLRQAGLIYMLGGFPGYLAETLRATRCWNAALKAFNDGAVLAGSSAGAMVLCEHLYDPRTRTVTRGLGVLPDICVIPHHDTFSRHWAAQLQKELPHAILVGIDEQTGLINDGPQGRWQVLGKGAVTIYSGKSTDRYESSAEFELGSGPGRFSH